MKSVFEYDWNRSSSSTKDDEGAGRSAGRFEFVPLYLIFAAVIAVVFGWLVTYVWACTPLTIASNESIVTYGLLATVFVGLLMAAFTHPKETSRYNNRSYRASKRYTIRCFAPVVLFVVVMIIIGIGSTAAFHAREYSQRIEVAEATDFKTADLPVFDPEQLPWVSEEQAQVLGDKKLGELGSIGSSARMGEYVRQKVDGRLYYVSPILHGGFFKWWGNKVGTPGYVMVSMTNDNDVRLVTEVDGNPIHIKYQPNAAWGDLLKRRVLFEYPNLAIAEWKFEVNDDLRPYWVGSYYHKTIGIAAPDVSGVLVVDAQTGVIENYSVADAPEWVDRIYPTSYIESQIDSWGLYQKGWANGVAFWGAKDDLTELTAGNTMVFKDGECYMFSGLTAKGNTDASTVGFILTNYRTKETVYYHRMGATEEAAMGVAEGHDRVKPSGFVAEFPVPVMVEGQPTYFFGLRDPNSNVNRMFALVNIEQHQIVGVGETINSAKLDYMTRLQTYKPGAIGTSSANLVELEGTVLRIGSYVDGGNTFYKFVLDSASDKICVSDASFQEISITNVGDRVRVSVIETAESIWSVSIFDNLEFDQKLSDLEESASQTELEVKLQEAETDPNVMSTEEFMTFFETLTPEQREQFMKDLEGLGE